MDHPCFNSSMQSELSNYYNPFIPSELSMNYNPFMPRELSKYYNPFMPSELSKYYNPFMRMDFLSIMTRLCRVNFLSNELLQTDRHAGRLAVRFCCSSSQSLEHWPGRPSSAVAASPTADSGVVSSILARSHTFVHD